jgi:hypothetical protein
MMLRSTVIAGGREAHFIAVMQQLLNALGSDRVLKLTLISYYVDGPDGERVVRYRVTSMN